MLTIEEKEFIYKQVNNGISIKEIKEIYQISQSTINRIVKDFRSNKNINNGRSNIKSRYIQNNSLWRVVLLFAKNSSNAFTWRDVKEYILNKHGIWIDTSIIRRILIDKLDYSYKRCSSRPLALDHKIAKLKKVLFALKLLNIINGSSIIVNVDEAILSYSTKTNYSWSRIGIPSNLSTQNMKGSVWIISSILSNGFSISGLRKGTIKLNSFIEYMDNLLDIWMKL